MTDPTTPPVPDLADPPDLEILNDIAARPHEYDRTDAHFAVEALPWLLAQAREAERLRVERGMAVTELQRVVGDADNDTNLLSLIDRASLEVQCEYDQRQALESALRPLLGTREATPENVAEAVRLYTRAEEAITVYAVTGSADEMVRWLRDFATWEQVLSADAARSEPEEKA